MTDIVLFGALGLGLGAVYFGGLYWNVRLFVAGSGTGRGGLWPVALADDLKRAMVEEGVRKVDIWTARYRLVTVDFAVEPVDPFFNTNRPEDLEEAERLLA